MYISNKNMYIYSPIIITDSTINSMFFNELFNATDIKGVVLFNVFAEYIKTVISTKPKTIQAIDKIVMLSLFLNKKLRYLTLAALIPSFKAPGAYSDINIRAAKANNVKTDATIINHITKPVHIQITIISTNEKPKAIRAAQENKLYASYKSNTTP